MLYYIHMTDPKYDKANKVGIENALELLEEELAQHEEEMLSIIIMFGNK